jgi:hypothetical protein
MQTTTGLENQITNALFPISDLIFNNTMPFDTTNRMFNANTQGGNPLVDVFV